VINQFIFNSVHIFKKIKLHINVCLSINKEHKYAHIYYKGIRDKGNDRHAELMRELLMADK